MPYVNALTDLIEAEEIQEGMARIEVYKKKNLNDPDNHNGVVIHQEPDILENKVKRASGSTAVNKASRGDGIPAELFKIQKDDAIICCTQYVSKFGKPSSGHRTGKGQFSSQFPRRAVLKNAQATRQLHFFLMRVRLCSESFKLGFIITCIRILHMFKLGLEKAEEPEVNCQHPLDHSESKGIPEKH